MQIGSNLQLFHPLLALAIIIGISSLLGQLVKKFGQPSVIGEIVGGIILGPSIFGRISGDLFHLIFAPPIISSLQIISQLGIIFYMFQIGLEFDIKHLRAYGKSTLLISYSSIILPFLFGLGLAFYTYPTLAQDNVDFLPFALFFGVSMSITALPVLTRILTDKRVQSTPLGTLCIACAAINDVTAWCLLALTIGCAKSQLLAAFITIALATTYVGVMLTLVKSFVARWLSTRPHFSYEQLSLLLVAVLISSCITEFIGIHAVFGAFIIGIIIPKESHLPHELKHRIQDFVSFFLMPPFFALTGLRTEINLINGLQGWLLCGAIIVLASIGKFGGTFIVARLTGHTWHNAAALGILMNTRGLVELIVLNIGLDLHIISPSLFTMLVIMALFTTFIAPPIFKMVTRKHPWVVHGGLQNKSA